MAGIEIVKKDALKEGPQTSGMVRKEAFISDNIWVGRVNTPPGTISGWHHHGAHETYVYIISGRIRFELDNSEVVEGSTGDFVKVPAQTSHRESNPGNEEQLLVVVRIGTGPTVINVNNMKT